MGRGRDRRPPPVAEDSLVRVALGPDLVAVAGGPGEGAPFVVHLIERVAQRIAFARIRVRPTDRYRVAACRWLPAKSRTHQRREFIETLAQIGWLRGREAPTRRPPRVLAT